MKADLTRDTFDPLRHYTRVLTQQGRVQLDAPANEQVAIHLHLLRTLARDLIGRHGGPDDAFAVGEADGSPGDFTIGAGHYYVDGILCENEREAAASCQPYWPAPPAQTEGWALIYLDVWEQYVNALEDPDLLEVALRGPDTATRARVIWQARTFPLSVNDPSPEDIDRIFDGLRGEPRPRLKARAHPEHIDDDPCTIPPQSRYRGVENHLYRVEIHRGGPAGHAAGGGEHGGGEKHPTYAWATATPLYPGPHPPGHGGGGGTGATFTWSRDNGSIAVGLDDSHTGALVVKSLGRDDRTSVEPGDWLEVVDDATSLLNLGTRGLLQVRAVDPDARELTLSGPVEEFPEHPQHVYLRRWDHAKGETEGLAEGAVPVVEGQWIPLEQGVEVWFEPGGQYRPGDYWLIPARYDTGDVLWRGEPDAPELCGPRGIDHHYAPLAIAEFDPDGGFTGAPTDLRRLFLELGGTQRAAARTLWTSSLGLVADDANPGAQLTIARDSTQNLVRLTPGEARVEHTLWLPVTVADDLKLQEVVLTYRVGGEGTAIAGLRVVEQREPGTLADVHQERVLLNSASSAAHRSALKDPRPPGGTWLVALAVEFGNVDGWIDVGSVGLVMR